MSRRLAIGLACYNVENSISTTLSSLLRQELDDVEVLVADDASTDATIDVVEAQRPAFERRGWDLKILRNAENSGVGITRNRIIDNAGAEYLGFVDPDDYLAGDYYASCLAHIGTADFLRTDYVQFSNRTRRHITASYPLWYREFDPRTAILPLDAQSGVDFANCWCGIYRMDFIRFNGVRFAETRTGEDRRFIWQCHLKGRRAIAISNPGYFYHRGPSNPTSLTSGKVVSTFDVFSVLEEIETIIRGEEFDLNYLKKLYRQATSMAEFHLKRRDHYGRAVYKELVNRLHQYVSTVDKEIFRIVVDDCSEYRRYLLKPFVK